MHKFDKMSFDQVDFFFNACFNAFHPDGMDEDQETDSRMIAVWNVFLTYSGWTEDEFWEAVEQNEHKCENCKIDIAAEKLEENKKVN